MSDRIVAEVRKSARELIRVSLKDRGGGLGCEMRIAETSGRGSMIETRKGLRVPLKQLGATIAALQEAQRLATSLGHLPGPGANGDNSAE